MREPDRTICRSDSPAARLPHTPELHIRGHEPPLDQDPEVTLGQCVKAGSVGYQRSAAGANRAAVKGDGAGRDIDTARARGPFDARPVKTEVRSRAGFTEPEVLRGDHVLGGL